MTTTAHRTSLADVRATDQAARTAEVERLVAVLAWLEQHLVDPRTSDDVAFPDYGDGELLLAGDGAPAVSEAAVVELVTSLGLSDGAGRHFLGIWLEVRYRLPRLWQRVLDLEVAPWRARRVAESTRSLPLEGAAYVDVKLDGFAHSLSWAQLERTVEAARVEFDPEEVERRRAADPRHFDVRIDRAGIDGYAYVDGLLDVADALDLDAAVSATAAQLTDLGCEESLGVRRAMAVGEIARAQLALDLDTEKPGRAVTLYVHLSESVVATLDNTGTHVLLDQVATWCGTATTVTVKPVRDLNAHHRVDGYAPTDPIREQVLLTWPGCVFPYCTRRARSCDLDHRVNHADGGATCPCNLAPLCRTHHRMKTFSGWTYEPAETTETGIPTAFTWTGPSGDQFRVDHDGSIPLPPEP